ncbi:DEAD-box ATP-dependent RNA helicase FANCM-like isoform X2 [Musa acuminata AAA Group]|uniref:DEAD-box ATP-dependent RNA helicase FANCM-like isoform X2 n=1 Tax=Musa acuminata AAA Group TaxID=214697 RepID=UPI0031D78C55
MATPALPLDDDDNDEFDWEAAVREIDDACQLASASTSTSNPQGFATPVATAGAPANLWRRGGEGRQSTLDRFVVDFHGTKRTRNDDGNRFGSRGREAKEEQNVVGGDEHLAVDIDLEAAKTWIYPVNVPLRDYQFSIARTALFSNTLVALPTGLGKTLIAAVVMYNYYRWFPEGKIVFTAPSRPLVMQQIEACHNIVGIPQEWTIDMTGQMSPPKRSAFWKSKRVFFVTPQVLEKDIQSGICLVKQLVCLVIDEAHRALGNYSYSVAVRELMTIPVQLRILALTATPGSKQRTVQNVIDNLHISTMEYRSESDHDVSPYVHNRTLELIQVAMSEDASVINNLLLEGIHPYVARLCTIGVLHNKDAAKWSPCELLNSRDKFRQAPPSSLPHVKYGEVEGCFGVLITLYHIRKLLSSHGVRPAYDMLQEKLRQGSFARMMSKNETILKAKLLMQRSLSHGAPNPKLVKMTEILMDHFKRKDFKESRVIIFSNFRGSVRDIMDTLSSIGDLVKATEFVGQNSGRTLKGQSQKVQQAVLQKFRTGSYNVIVATSIGEEGLNITEVDLVICFDANVSPLRMIQRMGRTGRKHDGRVVVLACEGSELKGYLKKQATSKTVRKHMHNGGINSFNFHDSPRMVPHICKPEVQFVELSIEQFIPRGKKIKEESGHQSPFLNKISKEEHDLISRYFDPSKTDTWRPSLIAFPGFQTFPSAVHIVRHSFKTTMMLIDAMQRLEGLSFSRAKKDLMVEVATSSQSIAGMITSQNNTMQENLLQGRTSDVEEPASGTSRSKDGSGATICTPPTHRFLFGGDLVKVNALGGVSIPNVPVLPLEGSVIYEIMRRNKNEFPSQEKNEITSKVSSPVHDGLPFENVLELPLNAGTHSPNIDVQQEHGRINAISQTPVPKQNAELTEVKIAETPGDQEKDITSTLVGESSKIFSCVELSPRLTLFIEKGIVPESPISTCKVDKVHAGLTSDESASMLQNKFLVDRAPSSTVMLDNVLKNELPALSSNSPNVSKLLGKMDLYNTEGNVIDMDMKESASPLVAEMQTPLINPVTSTDEWQMSSGSASKTIMQAPKYRRLCKYGEKVKRQSCRTLTDKYDCCVSKSTGPTVLSKPKEIDCHQGRKQKANKYFDNFIEEEAEVSEDAEVSVDEEDDEHDDKYEDSFIDDRTNPTEASSQTEINGGDMLAFYRRSLLTQSPMETLPKCLVDSVSSRATGSGSCSSVKVHSSLQTPQNGLQSSNHSSGRYSISCQADSKQGYLTTMCGQESSIQRESSSKLESRKRKLSFHNACSVPARNFQLESTVHSEPLGKEFSHYQPGSTGIGNDVFCDDEFYQSIDLDAVEAQATELLRYKTRLHVDKPPATVLNIPAEINEVNHPSFDLGL